MTSPTGLGSARRRAKRPHAFDDSPQFRLLKETTSFPVDERRGTAQNRRCLQRPFVAMQPARKLPLTTAQVPFARDLRGLGRSPPASVPLRRMVRWSAFCPRVPDRTEQLATGQPRVKLYRTDHGSLQLPRAVPASRAGQRRGARDETRTCREGALAAAGRCGNLARHSPGTRMEAFSLGNSRRLFQVRELEENLAALRPWNLQFEIPDVVGFADFVHSRRSVATSLFASQAHDTWDRALHFPYPNGRKLRDLVVLEAPDLALLRASAGRIARPVERRLSRRSFGNRTTRSGAAWHYREISSAWKHFTDSAIHLLERAEINAMCATDIARYYASINLDRLETRLHDIGCDLHAIGVILSGLRKWASVNGVAGLPIGPEASGILGNAFLIPVDRMLMPLGAQYVRWMDDYKFMGHDDQTCRSIVSPFDQILRTQGLTRSEEKSDYYPNSLVAIAALRDGRLASLGY